MKHIPNFITLLNLLAGCLAIVAIANGALTHASWWIILAAVLDLLDGAVARLTGSVSAIGKQLDSLADVVSFGVAPGFMIYALLNNAIAIYYPDNESMYYLAYMGFLIPLFAALRLARFNIDTGQEKNFLGLPTPAVALMVLSIPITVNCRLVEIPWLNDFLNHPWGLIAVAIVLSLLMVAPLRLFSLKISSIYWKYNRARYILIIFAVILFFSIRFASIPFILLMYIVLSLLKLNEAEAE
ncbi:MAG: CDP-diacylglycerol--serine O-phosphatidyltransferase [Bacteroidetes bacterium]|nr:CDP-diacylglycerol--serine O-phosphatidyltransferase [Bacteroidota bacterium]MCK5766622.1 CDP-diacylglycerol--serine O-phosphatidyltransferase [Bacteroidales bacterium]